MDADRTLQRAPAGTTKRPNDKRMLFRVFPRDTWSLLALALSLLQFLVVSSLLAIILKMHLDSFPFLDSCQNSNCFGSQTGVGGTVEVVTKVKAITVYHVIFILANGFQFMLAVDFVLNSSLMQLLPTMAFNAGLFGYSIIQLNSAASLLDASQIAIAKQQYPNFVYHQTATLEYIVIGALGLFSLFWIVVCFRLYKVFGWSIFKELGADIAVRRRLTFYYVYMLLLKIDTFFFVSFMGQYIALVLLRPNTLTQQDNLAWVNGIGGLVGSIILLVIAYYAVRRESNVLMTFMLLGLSGVMGFLITRLVDIYVNQDKYFGSKISLTLFSCLTLALCLATFVIAVFNFRNFGKGVKEQLENRGLAKNQMRMDDLDRDPYGRSTYDRQNSKWGPSLE